MSELCKSTLAAGAYATDATAELKELVVEFKCRKTKFNTLAK